MAEANAHYYATRDPLGAAGDFITAPEISQMFGELIGAALADCWVRAGKPDDIIYAELGPGRGTLAADALRALHRAGFTGDVRLVETSPVLRAAQAERVPDAKWHERIEDLPPRPVLLVANELLDALPVRHWIGGEQRHVALDGDRFVFSAEGEVREDSPARDGATRSIARHLVDHGGVALLIDYGHARSAAGDTLQSVRRHRFADVLADPGEQDVTAHVDFEALTKVAVESGASVVGPVGQGNWLERTGIAERAEALTRAHPERGAEIEAARHRLVDGDSMGRLFKVIALYAAGWPVPAGFEQ